MSQKQDDDGMTDYLDNNVECRRKKLIVPFGVQPSPMDIPHLCRDVCAKKCTCGEGDTCANPDYGTFSFNVMEKPIGHKCRNVTPRMRDTL